MIINKYVPLGTDIAGGAVPARNKETIPRLIKANYTYFAIIQVL